MGDTVQKPGGDSAVVRVHGKNKGIAMTVDSSAHYCLANHTVGGKQVVCEASRVFSSKRHETVFETMLPFSRGYPDMSVSLPVDRQRFSPLPEICS